MKRQRIILDHRSTNLESDEKSKKTCKSADDKVQYLMTQLECLIKKLDPIPIMDMLSTIYPEKYFEHCKKVTYNCDENNFGENKKSNLKKVSNDCQICCGQNMYQKFSDIKKHISIKHFK